MVVLESVKVDLRKICENEAKKVIKEYGLKHTVKQYSDNLVYFIQKAVGEDYEHLSDSKLQDGVWLVLYSGPDSEKEPTKKQIVDQIKYKTKQLTSPKKTRRLTSPKKREDPKKREESSECERENEESRERRAKNRREYE